MLLSLKAADGSGRQRTCSFYCCSLTWLNSNRLMHIIEAKWLLIFAFNLSNPPQDSLTCSEINCLPAEVIRPLMPFPWDIIPANLDWRLQWDKQQHEEMKALRFASFGGCERPTGPEGSTGPWRQHGAHEWLPVLSGWFGAISAEVFPWGHHIWRCVKWF